MRCLLVGLDAACLPVLRPLFESGRLPALERLFEEGATGPLESQVPPWTASAWPSLYTGTNPGEHGVFDFLSFDGYDWDVVNASDVRRRTLWECADERGLTSVVVNAPVTHPPRPFDGALIPGYLAPEGPTCHPAGLLEEVREAVGDYRVYARRETDERRDDEAKYEDYRELIRLRGEAFRYLVERFDPEFGFVQFQKTDAVFHDFPTARRIRGIYERVDEQVEAIREECDPDVVVVASDHGMGRYRGREFRVNEYLRRRGRVETARDGRGVPSWFQIKDERLADGGGGEGPGAGRALLARTAALAGRVGLTYQRGRALLERVGLADAVGRHVPVSAVFAASESVDHAASTAYLRSPSELGVRLNVAGREPDGVVAPEEYDATREAVIDDLRAATTPDGASVFERVAPREEFFEGPRVEDAPDVVAVPAAYDHALSALVGEEFADPEPWNHKPEGVIAVAGDGVDADAPLDGAHLFDVAPTVLAALGLPPDASMDGSVLPPVAAGAPDPASYGAFDPDEDRVATGDEAVEERLADLGYLE